MAMIGRRAFGLVLVGGALTLASLVVGPRAAMAIEAGEPAPDFKLPSTAGTDIALSDYKGKSFVFLEFYGSDFAPT
jgi:AhpC/TSA family